MVACAVWWRVLCGGVCNVVACRADTVRCVAVARAGVIPASQQPS